MRDLQNYEAYVDVLRKRCVDYPAVVSMLAAQLVMYLIKIF